MKQISKELEKEIIEFYKTNSNTITAEVYKLDHCLLKDILKRNNIENHTPNQNRELTSFYRFGYSNAGKSPEKQLKAKKTTEERHGNSNYRNHEKHKQTRIRNSGSLKASYQQGLEIVKQNNQEQYGVDYYFQTEEFKEKSKITCNEKYNVDNFRQSKQYAEQYKITCNEKYGVDHYSQTDQYKQQVKETCIERYDSASWFESEQGKQSCIAGMIKNWGVSNPMHSDEIKRERDKTFFNKYGVINPAQLPETHRKYALSRQTCYASDNTPFDSTWEIYFYEFCLLHNLSISLQNAVKYYKQDIQHTTLIDFIVNDRLVEIKGSHLLGGYFEDMTYKFEAYRNNNIIIITDEPEGRKYFNEESQLTGVGIELFDPRYDNSFVLWDNILKYIEPGKFLSLAEYIERTKK